ncbi:Y-family DNA polymerase [Candidatus Marinarcus aquaticus]|uniref:DNA polymerase IV n=1 Tax=Candidatus Marinarcus aquaticus TaxID=2044504 RepID=A0A4Q0XTL7_9BACT|nr:DNA polymerase IV [Candidatus Marinarcus aquaticus]RXJ60927.1 DNA polymerase IV [Candidatus Marinarcus aquaticus]
MILHLDLDCFFVSAHRTIDKSLEGIPTAVGGRSNLNIFDRKKAQRFISNNSGAFVSSIVSNNEGEDAEYFKDEHGRIRGIITTASYEARAYGVKTAMSVNEALQLCPHLKMIKPHYPLYHELSHKLAQFLSNRMPYIEQFSIDEFFGDVTGWVEKSEIKEFALNLQKEINEQLGLPISIGVAESKWIAKLVTEFAKPHGVKVVFKACEEEFIKDIPIEMFSGVGKGYAAKLHGYGISKLGQVKAKKELFYSWKKPGIQLYNRICGIDNEKISFYSDEYSVRKSIGIGRTFDPLQDRIELRRRVVILCRYLSFLVLKQGVNPQTFYLKIRYEFRSKSKNTVSTNRLFSEAYFKEEMLKLFDITDNHTTHRVVQLNIAVSNFNEQNPKSFNLFEYENDLQQAKLNKGIQELRSKFGIDIIKNASEL